MGDMETPFFMDINMPEKDGLQTIQSISKLGVQTNVIILSGYDDSDLVYRAMKLGAKGYILKTMASSKLIDAIEVVCAPEYQDAVWGWANKYKISKLKWVCDGGASCQESTRNGIFNLESKCRTDDIVTLNMSTSVFVNEPLGVIVKLLG